MPAQHPLADQPQHTPSMHWKLHLPNLIKEISNNPGTGVLRIPFMMLLNYLGQVAQRASEINDKELNGYMLRLALYTVGDPEDKANYDGAVVENPPGADAAACVNALAGIPNPADYIASLEKALTGLLTAFVTADAYPAWRDGGDNSRFIEMATAETNARAALTLKPKQP